MKNQVEDVDKKFDRWVEKIAQTVDLKKLIKHFREHVGSHYDRYDRSDPERLAVWLVDVLNFMHILERKELGITREDMLFKLCLHYKKQKDGPKPSFDIDEFIKNYNGRFKKYDVSKGEKPL